MDNVEAPPTLSTSSSFFTPLLISMIGIVSTSMIIVTYHLILTRYCRRRREARAEAVEPPFFHSRFLYGVDVKVLETIPIIAYSSQNHDLFGVDQCECAVCIGKLEDGEMVRVLPNCKHAFHVPCIDQWFVRNASCPVCRSPVVASTNREPVIPSPACVDQSNIRIVVSSHDHDHDRDRDPDHDHTGAENDPMNVKSCALLRHCVSLVLPMERNPRRLLTGLKRSLSMDQSSNIIIAIERDCERDSSSSSSSKGDLTRSRSIRHFDRVSTKLWRSFSQLSVGRQRRGILPY